MKKRERILKEAFWALSNISASREIQIQTLFVQKDLAFGYQTNGFDKLILLSSEMMQTSSFPI